MTTLALTLILVASAAPSPEAPALLVKAWYGDWFSAAEVPEPGVLRLSASEAFEKLPPEEQEALLTSAVTLALKGNSSEVQPRYVEVRAGDSGRVLHWTSTATTQAPLAEWGQSEAPPHQLSFSELRTLHPLMLSFSGLVGLNVGGLSVQATLRLGTFLFHGHWDVSVGLTGGLTLPPSVNAAGSLMVRRHFTFDAVPWLSPSVGLQGVLNVDVSKSFPLDGDAGVVVGVGLRAGGRGVVDVIFFQSLTTTSLTAGYSLMF